MKVVYPQGKNSNNIEGHMVKKVFCGSPVPLIVEIFKFISRNTM